MMFSVDRSRLRSEAAPASRRGPLTPREVLALEGYASTHIAVVEILAGRLTASGIAHFLPGFTCREVREIASIAGISLQIRYPLSEAFRAELGLDPEVK